MMDLAVEDVTVEQEDAVRTRTRRCIATRAPRPAQTLIRFVVGPGSTLVPDLAGRLPGRHVGPVERGDRRPQLIQGRDVRIGQ